MDYLENNLDINKLDENGYSPLDIALEKEETKKIELLMSKGAKPFKNKDRHLIAYCKLGDLNIVKYLEANGANIHTTYQEIRENKKGDNSIAPNLTLLDTAIERSNLEVARYLQSKNVNISKNPDTHLLRVCGNGNLNLVTFLVNYCNANVNAVTALGLSAMDIAILNSKQDIIEYLITKNVPVYDIDKKRRLFSAIENFENDVNFNTKLITYLIQQGADLKTKKINEKSPIGRLLSKYKFTFLNG
ncbi:ankyrin repeat domain-containing protein, partial [Candidatus Dependentiae bacterium]